MRVTAAAYTAHMTQALPVHRNYLYTPHSPQPPLLHFRKSFTHSLNCQPDSSKSSFQAKAAAASAAASSTAAAASAGAASSTTAAASAAANR